MELSVDMTQKEYEKEMADLQNFMPNMHDFHKITMSHIIEAVHDKNDSEEASLALLSMCIKQQAQIDKLHTAHEAMASLLADVMEECNEKRS